MTDLRETPRSLLTWAALFLAAVLPVLAWPGDVSWTNDEPRLLAAAWHSNHAGQLASGGLYGNFGLRYGPLPTQIYQALLAVAPDPLTLALLRSALCASVTTGALLWLARSLGLTPWFAVALGFAPQVWQYQRILWDASFTIPLGALTLAATAAFFQQGTRARLLVALGAALLLPLIHPQALPLAAAILGGLLLRGRRELRHHWIGVLSVLAVIGALHAVYFVEVAVALCDRLGGAVRSGYPAGSSHAAAALAPLLGGTLFSEAHFGGAVGPAEHLPFFWPLAAWVSRLIFPLSWIGIALTAGLAFRRITGQENAVRTLVARVVLATLLLQAVIFGLMRVPADPQYFFGTFAVHALLPWLAVDALRWRRLGAIFGGGYGVAVVALTVSGMLALHRHGYAAEPPRARLAEQVAVVRELNSLNATARTDAAIYQQYPQALRALRLLLPPAVETASLPAEPIVIHGPPARPRLELAREADPDAALTPLDLTPLPRGWPPPAESSSH